MFWQERSEWPYVHGNESTKVAVKKKGRRTKRTKKLGVLTRLNFKAVVFWLLVLFFLGFTMAALFYVVFFQTVVALEADLLLTPFFVSLV